MSPATRTRTTSLPTLAALVLCGAAGGCEKTPLRLGATFTLEQSGALGGIDTLWTGSRFVVVVGPSGQVLRSAAAGDLDVVITHAPALEQRLLVEPGHATLACPLFASRFAIAGPPNDPAGIRRLATGVAAMRRIASVGAIFVSRGDSSGTHQKERELWRLAGVNPDGELWHIESGASQAANLLQASNWKGYTLTDLPTFATTRNVELEALVGSPDDTTLTNPYTLYLVNTPAPRPEARPLADWLATAWRDHVLQLQLPTGDAAFVPRGGNCAAPAPQR